MSAIERRVVFRADAGRAIGGGHVMRCLALACALKDEGWQPSFAGSPETLAAVGALEQWGFDWHALENPAAPQDLTRTSVGCDLLVLDSYQLDVEYESACRGWAKEIMVIDDLANRIHDCDFLLDQTLGRIPQHYGARVPPRCKVLTGPDYALLRPSFAGRRGARDASAVGRVLISFGMVDAAGFLPQAIPVVRSILPDAEIDMVVGSYTPHLARLRTLTAADSKLNLHVDSGGMPELMQMADIALIAAGTTVWEVCCMTLPSVLLVVAENQRSVAAAMRSTGAVEVAESVAELAPALRNLVDDSAKRREAAVRLGAICDGRGARRVALALRPELAGGRPILLRRMTEADAQPLLVWQSDPVTRRFARNPTIPSQQEHLNWFTAKLRDPNCLFNMITEDGEDAGMLRLDRRQSEAVPAFEISILVAPGRYGRGIGGAALRAARRLIPEAEIYAEVHADNVASHALFSAAGYARREGWYVSPPVQEVVM